MSILKLCRAFVFYFICGLVYYSFASLPAFSSPKKNHSKKVEIKAELDPALLLRCEIISTQNSSFAALFSSFEAARIHLSDAQQQELLASFMALAIEIDQNPNVFFKIIHSVLEKNAKCFMGRVTYNFFLKKLGVRLELAPQIASSAMILIISEPLRVQEFVSLFNQERVAHSMRAWNVPLVRLALLDHWATIETSDSGLVVQLGRQLEDAKVRKTSSQEATLIGLLDSPYHHFAITKLKELRGWDLTNLPFSIDWTIAIAARILKLDGYEIHRAAPTQLYWVKNESRKALLLPLTEKALIEKTAAALEVFKRAPELSEKLKLLPIATEHAEEILFQLLHQNGWEYDVSKQEWQPKPSSH